MGRNLPRAGGVGDRDGPSVQQLRLLHSAAVAAKLSRSDLSRAAQRSRRDGSDAVPGGLRGRQLQRMVRRQPAAARYADDDGAQDAANDGVWTGRGGGVRYALCALGRTGGGPRNNIGRRHREGWGVDVNHLDVAPRYAGIDRASPTPSPRCRGSSASPPPASSCRRRVRTPTSSILPPPFTWWASSRSTCGAAGSAKSDSALPNVAPPPSDCRRERPPPALLIRRFRIPARPPRAIF